MTPSPPSRNLLSFLFRSWLQKIVASSHKTTSTPHLDSFYNYNPLSSILERQFFYQKPLVATIPIRAQPSHHRNMIFRTGIPKTFSTAARIHPNIQPLNPASRMPRLSGGGRKWVFPTLALIALGTAITADQMSQARQHHLQEQIAIQDAHRKRQQALMEAYGNKESLEDLEAALDYYEVQ